ncbi:UNVERIFIED_CONTAM: hypothetical protein K2H54_048666 [Gekko kuhli]
METVEPLSSSNQSQSVLVTFCTPRIPRILLQTDQKALSNPVVESKSMLPRKVHRNLRLCTDLEAEAMESTLFRDVTADQLNTTVTNTNCDVIIHSIPMNDCSENETSHHKLSALANLQTYTSDIDNGCVIFDTNGSLNQLTEMD